MIDENIAKYRTINQLERKDGTLIYQDLLDAYEFFDGKCPYSGTPIDESVWHLEHIISVKMGGTTDPWNCIPVCGPCNLSKGADHLLDWWDKIHKPEDAEKLEKIFLYIIKALNKERKFRITTQEDKEKLDKLKQEEQLEENSLPITDDYIEPIKKLDTFTFMYQLLNHLIESKQIEPDKLIKYANMFKSCFEKNKQYKISDIKYYELQNDLTNYLKQINVVKHYKISYEYFDINTNLNTIKENITNISNYLNNINIGPLIDKNPKLLFMNINTFKHNFEYLAKEVKIPINIIIQKPYLLNEIELAKEFYNTCIDINFDINNMTNSAFKRGKLRQFIKILKSNEYKEHPELFTSTTLAHSTPERIQAIIASKEFEEHPELFTSQVLAYSTPERIQAIIASKEFEEHPELFTSQVLAHSTPERIQAIIASKEFEEHPELFTSQVLAHNTPERIQAIIASKEFEEHPELFTSEVLAHSTPERIQAIIASKEFEEHPDLFTSTILAHSTPERISEILSMPEWQEDKYKHLLQSSILLRKKETLVTNITLAEQYGFDDNLNINYMKKSPSQNYALI